MHRFRLGTHVAVLYGAASKQNQLIEKKFPLLLLCHYHPVLRVSQIQKIFTVKGSIRGWKSCLLFTLFMKNKHFWDTLLDVG